MASRLPYASGKSSGNSVRHPLADEFKMPDLLAGLMGRKGMFGFDLGKWGTVLFAAAVAFIASFARWLTYPIWENPDKAANLAQVAIGILAFVALLLALAQIISSRDSQREATAKDIYRDFLRLAFNHQKYDNPCAQSLRGDRKYQRYVGILLNACDEIACQTPFNKKLKSMWEKVIRKELEPHSCYLRSREFAGVGGWDLYSDNLTRIWKTVEEETLKSNQ